jgi:hypothetical protein
MAKLNWQKVHTQSLMQSAREQEWHEQRIKQAKKRANILLHDKHWQIGKHKGMEVKKLPIHYLCFVSETFDKESAYKKRADMELRRRYKKLSTQG